jgi:hypothetical protein
MALTKYVDNQPVLCSPQEEAQIRSEWAQNDGKAVAEARTRMAREKRIVALEKVLEKLLEQNAAIPEVADYLSAR